MRRRLCVLIAICCVLFTSCSSPSLREANIEKLELGMSIEQVRELLGPPDEDLGSGVPLDMYILNDDEVVVIGYTFDTEGNFQVEQICFRRPME